MPIFRVRPDEVAKNPRRKLTNAEALFIAALFGIFGLTYGIFIVIPYDSDKLVAPDAQAYPYHVPLTKVDISNSSNVFEMKVTQLSTTFSAQALIGVSMEIEQVKGTPPDFLYVLLPRANWYDHPANHPDFSTYVVDTTEFNKNFRGLEVELYNVTQNNPRPTNIAVNIRYEIGGCYNIELASDIERARTLDVFDPTACSEIQVASLEVTAISESNRVNFDIAKSSLRQSEQNLRLTQVFLVWSVYGTMLAIYETLSRRESSSRQPPQLRTQQ